VNEESVNNILFAKLSFDLIRETLLLDELDELLDDEELLRLLDDLELLDLHELLLDLEEDDELLDEELRHEELLLDELDDFMYSYSGGVKLDVHLATPLHTLTLSIQALRCSEPYDVAPIVNGWLESNADHPSQILAPSIKLPLTKKYSQLPLLHTAK